LPVLQLLQWAWAEELLLLAMPGDVWHAAWMLLAATYFALNDPLSLNALRLMSCIAQCSIRNHHDDIVSGHPLQIGACLILSKVSRLSHCRASFPKNVHEL
jgi:hypothetical protein